MYLRDFIIIYRTVHHDGDWYFPYPSIVQGMSGVGAVEARLVCGGDFLKVGYLWVGEPGRSPSIMSGYRVGHIP